MLRILSLSPPAQGCFYFMGGAAGEGMRFCTSAYRPQSAQQLADEIEAALVHIEAVLEADGDATSSAG